MAYDRIPIFPGKTLPSWGQALLSEDFELLCRDGTRADVTEWRRCHLARVPAHAVVVRADTDGSLIFRLLNEGQVSSGHPTQLLGVAGPSHLSPGWGLRAIPGPHQPDQGQDPEAEHVSK